jgi:hypothetical protein
MSDRAQKGYMGNVNLKRENVKIKYTKKQFEEFTKCLQDPVYFIENYIKIVHVDKGFIPFEPWDFQKEMISTIVGNRYVICKLPRQSGKCCYINTMIRVRNKRTKQVLTVSIGEFFNEYAKRKNKE